ncbi:hypothetical protein E2562_001223 [Oryza meyeriana var. granulata]|uniref:Uncharacterized protein n=1 Tax=Oryza meyeriana var. granulata TaxID=110450 RepID=A0A6G1DC05_9ORYZ|nr:hypothetical protein E2562_001223 [Oryza meyeriana var. granulata]
MKPGAVAASGGTVAFAWEHEPGVSKQSATTAAGEATSKPLAEEEEEAGERAATKKAPALQHRIRVRPPPGAPGRGGRRGGAVVRPEEDPFLAAFLACTERGNKAPKGVQKLLGLGLGLGLGSGLGLSCKGPGDVVQSVVRLAKMPQALNDD